MNFGDMRLLMAATLVAFFAVGFFAATLLPLFRFMALIFIATAVVAVVACIQSVSSLHVLGLCVASLAVAQVGYGLGMAWGASTGPRCIGD